jgi:hypothetical protein
VTLVATAAVAPLNAEPSVRSEQVTQLLLGETAELLEAQGSWRRVRTHDVAYEAWVHAGYVRLLDAEAAAAWRERSVWRSVGAVLEAAPPARHAGGSSPARHPEGAEPATGSGRLTLPLGARLIMERGDVILPDGRRARVCDGVVRSAAEIAVEATRMPPHDWALAEFGGSPYQWGGRTPWGVDCSGLVQATWAARGIQLPRDSGQQVAIGDDVAPSAMRPGDLLFFRSDTGRDVITHIAFLAEGDTLVHSTIDCGGVLREPWGPGTRAHALRARLAAVRRV